MLYVIARIDEKSRLKLETMREVAAQFGIVSKPVHGHITLATYECEKEEEIIEHCKKILCGRKKFPVFYNEIEVLETTSIIVATLQKEGILQSMQKELASDYCEYIAEWMKSEVWYPHTTLLNDETANLELIAQPMKVAFESFEAKVEHIEFSKETDTGYEIIDTIELI